MVSPDQKSKQCDRYRTVGNEAITENALVTVYTDQFADNAEGRQNHDVDSWVTVEPKEVFIGNRVAVEFRIEDPDVHRSLGDQQQQRDPEHRGRQNLNDAR